MKRIAFSRLSIWLLLAAALPVPAQFTPGEVADRAKWEEFLRKAEIIHEGKTADGVTKPFRLTLKNGGVEHDACWKNPSGIQGGFLEGWQYEIAAYEMDKLLGLNMIPPTVEREYKGKRGALSFWAESKTRLLEMLTNRVQPPDSALDKLEKSKYIVRAFDALIANEDRNQQNILYTEDWRAIIIDHSRAFRCSKEFIEKLMTGKDAKGGTPLLFRKLPRDFIEKIKGLTFENIKQAVGHYLTDAEIEAILARRPLILKEVEEMIKEFGEAYVLYESMAAGPALLTSLSKGPA